MRQNAGVPGRIVVGIDGTEHAAAALRWAADEAGLRSATLVVVHAWSFVPVTTPADSGLDASMNARLDNELRDLD